MQLQYASAQRPYATIILHLSYLGDASKNCWLLIVIRENYLNSKVKYCPSIRMDSKGMFLYRHKEYLWLEGNQVKNVLL